MQRSFQLCLGLLCAPCLLQAHDLKIEEKKRLEATISAEHPSRIQVVGDRIANIFVPEDLSVETDEDTGQAFVLPLSAEKHKEYAITLTTESGLTQDLLLKTIESKGELLRLIAQARATSNNSPHISGTNRVHEIVRRIAKGEVPEGFSQTQSAPIREIWPGIQGKIMNDLEGEGLSVQVVELTNFASTEHTFREEDLFFSPDVIALALEEYILKPGYRTKAIIVRKSNA